MAGAENPLARFQTGPDVQAAARRVPGVVKPGTKDALRLYRKYRPGNPKEKLPHCRRNLPA